MFHELTEVPEGKTLDYDICIVGSGPAGLALATKLEGSSVRVCVLESGARTVEDRFQDLNQGRSVGLDYDFMGSRCRAFGGTTHRWEGACTPLDPVDFTSRSWVPHSGWPIRRDELLPFYEPALRFLGLGDFQLYEPDSLSSRRQRCSNELGLLDSGFEPKILQYLLPPTNLGTSLSQLVRASGSIDCYLDATVTEIVPSRNGAVADHVEVRSLAGHRARVRAPAFAICAGGLESARILLLSDSLHPRGLGNQHDQVGRYFMDHLRFTTDFVSLRRRIQTLAHAAVPIEGGFLKVGFKVRPGLQRERRILNPNLLLVWDGFGPEEAAALEGIRRLTAVLRRSAGRQDADLANLLRKPHIVARVAWKRLLQRPLYRQLALCSNHEQSPNPSSRVMLSDARDALGLRKLKVDWRLQDLDWHSIERFHGMIESAFAETGLPGEAFEFHGPDETRPFDDSSHPMGTTRMSEDPKRGVVDRDCRVHSVTNLYVCGSSVFPTAGNANPTLTIVALALRLAEHLGRRLR